MIFVSRAIILIVIWFQFLVVCNVCLKQQGQAAPSQKLLLSKAVFVAVLQYSHRKIQDKGLFEDKENEPAINNFILCTENGLAGLFTEEKSRRDITARKFVEEMKQEYRPIARSQRPEMF